MARVILPIRIVTPEVQAEFLAETFTIFAETVDVGFWYDFISGDNFGIYSETQTSQLPAASSYQTITSLWKIQP